MFPATLRVARLPRAAVRPQTLAATGRAPGWPSPSFSTQSRPLIRSKQTTIAVSRPFQSSLRTQMSTKPPVQPTTIDKQHEKELGQQKLKARPDEVTEESSVRHAFEQSQAPPPKDREVTADLKEDLHAIKDTFALSTVPREAFTLGLAGTLPYLATSLSTVLLSWNLNVDWPTQSSFLNSFLFSHETAAYWLQLIEPIQIGYGAVIISFLGAIHWGLEFGEKAPLPERTRLRYTIGTLAPAVAWPSAFLPLEWALTVQFGAFAALYFVDSQATVRGWAPAWYSTYRFVLTGVVGIAILISLIGRAKIDQSLNRLATGELADRMHETPRGDGKQHNWAQEEAEEKNKLKEEKKKREEEEKKKEQEEQKKKDAEEQKKPEGGKKQESSEGKQGKEDPDNKAGNDKEEKKEGKTEEKEGKKKEKKADSSEEKDKQEDKESQQSEKKADDNAGDKSKGDEKEGGNKGEQA
ncbi:uncharacterized protein C8A04DRAFT_36055 [Dichotomopilus funicola]|uniref:Mitochondrial inner membrane protein 1 n=1 Tax=Dichotomopilus funicola TaxID=1934379 RepID=A0AAN6V7S3_9PEZI|nr:hypothetical protein C8A04DRAFT_36055 [Dichotomopilus funicola]